MEGISKVFVFQGLSKHSIHELAKAWGPNLFDLTINVLRFIVKLSKTEKNTTILYVQFTTILDFIYVTFELHT